MTEQRNQIIIFHRSKQNAYRSLANQKAFIETYKKYLSLTTIDYVTGDHPQAKKISKLIDKHNYGKFMVIMNDIFSQREYEQQFDLYTYFKSLKTINMAELYMMDSEGKLYKEIENIRDPW